jgi:hypothetical protein
MLQGIYERLLAAGMRLPQTWSDEVTTWGQQVALFRGYAEGDHRAKLTPEMREMLRISGSVLDTFTLNYCDLVIAKMGDRLTVAGIEADNKAGSDWAAELLGANRIDGLQMDVHDASLRDGITFVIAAPREDGSVMLAHELCWDGDTGMIPVYDRMGKQIVAAVKVWYEQALDRRVNIYFADRVEKFDMDIGGALSVHLDEGPGPDELRDRGEVNGVVPWVDLNKKPLGVPVIPFVNRMKARLSYGISEIASVIPGQDALNRTLVSMVMTAELSAFQIKVARGFTPPAAVAPGAIITIGADGLTNEQVADMSVLPQASLVPFISEAQFLIEQMGTISQTPLPGQMGGDASSGEALKQREIGLLGKVKRFQVKAGNAWEDVLKVAAVVNNAYAQTRAPQVKRWTCRWEDADIRNDAEVITNAVKMAAIVGEREFLRLVAPVWGYDSAKIDAILAEKRLAQADQLAALAGNLPGFDNFTAPVQ